MAEKIKSKLFRVATEGATADGRTIERSWLVQMAQSYNRTKYAARVWMEHIRGFMPDGDFGAYGDVIALESREVEDGKLALFAQIEPLPRLVELNKAKQKLYTSMEIDYNFAKTGSAYLVGLAVTDTPASLSTEILAFSAANPDVSPFTARKQSKDNLFTAAIETTFEFEVEVEKPSLADQVKALFSANKSAKKQSDNMSADASEAIELITGHVVDLDKKVDGFAAMLSGVAALEGNFVELQRQHTELLSKLSKQDAHPASKRPPAAGGDGQIQTDC